MSLVKAVLAGILIIVIGTAVGCSSAQTLNEMNYALTDIQSAVGNIIPSGIQKVSSNQRVFTSEYFIPSKVIRDYDRKHKSQGLRRAIAQVSVLGDRRPYKIEVVVDVQERINEASIDRAKKFDILSGQFESVGSDSSIARQIASDIESYLIRRGETKNVIDDFRPF